ncbi:hypothetical protein ACN27G_07530 [Plantactinospora sp. WMMB334]|uniref:hypothetical protein n=1 Tax=Plantactinospora sp. WMMB334 TaxID=3404119 RepID=UPI003B937D16
MSAADLAVEAGLPAVGLAVWIATYWIARLATRPARITPGAPTADPPGPESPAVVGLLANRWRFTPDAARAALLDLAARGHLWQRRVVEGSGRTYVPVNHHLVIDDGRSGRTRAWVLPEEIAGRCRLGDVVTARVRPWARRARDVTVHRPAGSGATGSAPGTLPPDAASDGPAGVSRWS